MPSSHWPEGILAVFKGSHQHEKQKSVRRGARSLSVLFGAKTGNTGAGSAGSTFNIASGTAYALYASDYWPGSALRILATSRQTPSPAVP